MERRLSKTEKKIGVTGFLFMMIVLLYDKFSINRDVFVIIFTIYYYCMLFYWYTEIKEKLKEKWDDIKEIRGKKYFYITEPKYKTDVRKRRGVGFSLLISTYVIAIAVILFFNCLNILRTRLSGSIFIVILYLIFFLLISAILLHLRYYWTSAYYYIIPIFSLSLPLGNLDRISSTSSIGWYFLVTGGIYLLFVILLPIPYLRKVANSQLVFGALFSIIIPTLFNYILSNYLLSKMQYYEFTSHAIQNSKLPKELMRIISNPTVVSKINNLMKVIYPVILRSQLEVLSTISFLWLSGYVLGSLIIKIKLNLGEEKAKEIYSKLLNDRDDQVCKNHYQNLRDCVFYGGESFQNRIMDNDDFRKIIKSREPKEFKPIKHEWYVKLIIYIWNYILKKLKNRI
ncbi:hypothetical protein ACVRXF_06910 [Streptococcus orisasini]